MVGVTDRAHVPFALIGVLLVLSSVAVVASLQTGSSAGPVVDREMEQLTAETQTALREASMTAARNAGMEPVTEPAGTGVGAAIRENRSFEDALRIRLYVRARESLERLSTTQTELQVGASLPGAETTEELRQARNGIIVERAGENGTKLRVTVEDVSLRVTRDGRTVASKVVSPTIVVNSPVLAVHDRVEEYEHRLDAGAFEPGLGHRLNTRLYAIAWARGYAQYAGTPIRNVVANRHVSLVTNGAILDIQREAFGHSDPIGRATFRRAVVETGVSDLLSGVDHRVTDPITDARDHGEFKRTPTESLDRLQPDPASPSPEDNVTVGINETADEAFLAAVERLNGTIAETYSEDVRLDASITRLGSERVRSGDRPGAGYGLTDQWTRTTARAVGTSDVEPPPVTGHWHRHGFHGRTVEKRTTRIRRWSDGQNTTTTRTTRVVTYEVGLSLLGRHTRGLAPARPIETVHEPGGPFDGPNLADIPERARERLIQGRGGPDKLAERAVLGRLDTDIEPVYGAYPPALFAWVYADLAEMRESTAGITTTNQGGELATLEANVAAQLEAKLEARRSGMIDTPGQYTNVSHRALVAARIAYLEGLSEELADRAGEHDRNRALLADHLPDRAENWFDRLEAGTTQQPRTEPAPTGLGIRMRIDATPPYMPTEAVGNDTVPAVAEGHEEYPLVVRNVNLVAAPYDGVSEWLVSLLFGPERTSLHTAGSTLRATELAVNREGSTTVTTAQAGHGHGAGEHASGLDRSRHALGQSVTANADVLETTATETLAGFDIGTVKTRETLVASALSEWETPADRAIALTNGSAANAIHVAAVRRWGDSLTDTEADRLGVELDVRLREAQRETTRPRAGLVSAADDDLHEFLRRQTADRLSDGLETAANETGKRVTGRALSQLPRGLPVAPYPGFWYATVNYWHVQVRGEHTRFTVRVPSGSPDVPGGELVYVRDGAPVRVDVTGDGSPELLGTAERITFESGADVAVAVPAGPRGVGDVDGNRDEQSPGWPEPGPRVDGP